MLATVSKSTSAVFHGLIGFFAGLVRNLVNLLLRFLSGIDLSNPRVRQAVYWISVGGVMTLIFFGIHFLNDKREVAMKIPPKVTHSAAVRKVVVPAPVIPKPEPKTENVQSAETDNRAAQGAEESREAATVAETSIAAKAFVVQVATYVNEDDAKAVIDRFRRASFSAVVKVQRRSEGKHFYSVFLGPYESYRKAQEDLAKFKKNDVSKPFQDAFIRSMAQ
jgi:hypothetical protein